MYKSSSSSSSSSYETLTLPSLSSLSSYILNYSHFDTNCNQWFCFTGCWTVARVTGTAQRASPPWHIPGIPSPHNLIFSYHHTIISPWYHNLISSSLFCQCGEPRGFFGKPSHFLESIILALPKSVSSIVCITIIPILPVTINVTIIIITIIITIITIIIMAYQQNSKEN